MNINLDDINLDDLYTDLQGLSKVLEGGSSINEDDQPEAYRILLDAMYVVRKITPVVDVARVDTIIRPSFGDG